MSKRTTPNYGWTVPEDDELIRDGAEAIRSLGTEVDRDLHTLAISKPDVTPYQTITAHNTAMAGKASAADMNGKIANGGSTGRRVVAGSAVTTVGGFNTFAFTTAGLWSPEIVVLTNGDQAAFKGWYALLSISGQTVSGVALDAAVPSALMGTAIRINWMAVGT